MNFFEDLRLGERRELGSHTFTAEDIKAFAIRYDPDPAPDGPISIAREEWDEVVAEMEQIGVPIKTDREQAWRDFAGWRVNYDSVLVALADLTTAPDAPWSSDRAGDRSTVPSMLDLLRRRDPRRNAATRS
jgi:hypothetical protein